MTWKEEIKKDTIEGQPLSEVINTIEATLRSPNRKAGKKDSEPFGMENRNITIGSNLLELILLYLKKQV